VADLNSKLEEKNQYLEDQLNNMREQMLILCNQTKELQDEREEFRLQIQSQNAYIM